MSFCYPSPQWMMLIVTVAAAWGGASLPAASGQDKPRQARTDVTQGEDVGSNGEHPLRHLAALMVDARQRLGDRDTSEETLTIQQNIVAGLTQLLEQEPQQQPAAPTSAPSEPPRSRPASGQRPGGPPNNGETGAGSNGSPPARLLTDQIWGHLPPEVRQQIEAPLHEEFLPRYDRIIQDYFERLANEPTP